MNRTNLFLDIGIFAAFIAASAPRFTGETVHEWLSLALAATLLVHLLLHWNWIVTVGVSFFRKVWHSSRLQFIVDILVFAVFITVMVSGIMISRSVLGALGIQLDANRNWKMIHSASANATLYLTGLHFALHWKWVVCMVRKYISSPLLSVFHPRSQAQTVLVEIQDK